jgi:hypothetical protein
MKFNVALNARDDHLLAAVISAATNGAGNTLVAGTAG